MGEKSNNNFKEQFNNDDLCYHIKQGDYENVKLLLVKGIDIHYCNDRALKYAAYNGNLGLVELLINNSADINPEICPSNHNTKKWVNQDIISYLTIGDFYLSKLSIEKFSGLFIDDSKPLTWASYNGHYELVKFLLMNGTDIHADDESALKIAGICGQSKIVKLLLDNGANIHANDDFVLRYSAKNGFLKYM